MVMSNIFGSGFLCAMVSWQDELLRDRNYYMFIDFRTGNIIAKILSKCPESFRIAGKLYKTVIRLWLLQMTMWMQVFCFKYVFV